MGKKKGANILLAVMGVLILAELVITIYEHISGIAPSYNFINLISIAGVALYGFWLYRMPHGNLLKYVMMLMALSIVVSSVLSVYQWGDPFMEVFPPIFAACLIFYTAGRLDRIDSNIYLMIIIGVILLIGCVIEMVSVSVDNTYVVIRYLVGPRPFISFLTLMIAYFVRYKAHKEAGLADTPEKQ